LKKNKIYNIPCERGIEKLKNESVDLLLTDPPYGIAQNDKLTKQGNDIINNEKAWGSDYKDSWESVEEYSNWLINIVEKTIPKIKNNGSLILFMDRKLTGYIIYKLEQLGLIFRNKIYFIKKNPLPHFRKNNYRSTIEEAVWFTKSKKYKINFLEQKDMRQEFYGVIGANKHTSHPNEKYQWMIEPLIRRHSNQNDLVLDLFSGSGVISYYSRSMKRNFIGFELKKEFYDISLELLKKENCLIKEYDFVYKNDSFNSTQQKLIKTE